jgi:hypothetical protein
MEGGDRLDYEFPGLPCIGRVKSHGRVTRGFSCSPYLVAACSFMHVDGFPYNRAIGSRQTELFSLAKFSVMEVQLGTHASFCLDLATEWMIASYSPLIRAGLMSENECLRHMDGSTNPGWPELLSYKDKRSCVWDVRWQREYDSYKSSMFTDFPERIFSKFSMKPELLKVSKLDAAEQRIINMTGLKHCLLCNCFDLDFNLQLTNACGLNGSRVGMSMQKHGAHDYVTSLSSHKYAFELDAWRQEMSFQRFLCEAVTKIRRGCVAALSSLTSLFGKAYTYVAREKFEGPVVDSEGWVYWLSWILKSGQISTLHDNTLGSEARLMAVFISLYHKEYGVWPTLHDWKTRVSVCIVGDDVNYSTDDEWFFAEHVIPEYYRLFYVVMKTDTYEPRSAHELTFLSHEIYLHPDGCFQGKLNSEKMLCSLLFNGETQDFLGDLQRVVSIRQMVGNNPEMVDLCDKIIYNLRAHFPLWADDQRFKNIMASYKSPQQLYDLWHGPHSAALNS